jgi:predicted alpha/beta hydrolase
MTSGSMTLTADDGYSLAATCFEARGSRVGSIVVASATGVGQQFYRRFAEYASGRGFSVLTFDYRGIGRSRPANLKGLEVDLLDWGRRDLAAAFDAMKDDGVPLFGVGHSIGGHAFGLAPNHRDVAKFYTFGTGTGWYGWMPPYDRARVWLMWKLVLPLLTAWKGYAPWSILGMGDDLPLGVYRKFSRWCCLPRHFFDDPAMNGIEKKYAEVRTPIVAANALDDTLSLPRSRDAFMFAYCNAPVTRLDLDPRPLGGIGHLGYFRQHAEPLWRDALDWFLGIGAAGGAVESTCTLQGLTGRNR